MNTETKLTTHTAGPWAVDATVALGAYGVWTEEGTHPGAIPGQMYPTHICSVDPMRDDISKEERNANMRLIAAAPDLLSCVEATMRILDGWGPEQRGHTLELLHQKLSKTLKQIR
jgi:hypothetical protein